MYYVITSISLDKNKVYINHSITHQTTIVIVLTFLFFHDIIKIHHFSVLRLRSIKDYDYRTYFRYNILLYHKLILYLNINLNQL